MQHGRLCGIDISPTLAVLSRSKASVGTRTSVQHSKPYGRYLHLRSLQSELSYRRDKCSPTFSAASRRTPSPRAIVPHRHRPSARGVGLHEPFLRSASCPPTSAARTGARAHTHDGAPAERSGIPDRQLGNTEVLTARASGQRRRPPLRHSNVPLRPEPRGAGRLLFYMDRPGSGPQIMPTARRSAFRAYR